ncbi:Hypothetical protein NTJ_04678 [Nesidiocoris tenuis]|uniref:Glucose-6-phosphate isomerase n=1 Tax=Nesidiocoris tenuis TaxID=355587 RepID=A0ABN7AHY5_9HEMI|nr:Hypothetical protein NTJ_04678 [Nesidiocoris tenuis]
MMVRGIPHHTHITVVDLLEKMFKFVDSVHSGQWTGCDGKPFTDIVVIGQIGLTLASQMATEALPGYRTSLEMHYINNVDGTAMVDVLTKVKRCTTLFVIISENFDDPIVLRNSATAKKWFLKWSSAKDMAQHFVAVTLNKPEAIHFGVLPCNVFRYCEYAAECHSVWGAIGLPLALSLGKENFATFLAGGKHMDDHFKSAPIDTNIPIILAMIGIWYNNFFCAETQAVLPYDPNLRSFPSYVQFLNMKSNGKQYIGLNQSEANFQTSPIVWGGNLEENCQLLHQGTATVPCDFIVSAMPHDGITDQHKTLIAHCISHGEILMKGWPNETRESKNSHPGSGEPSEVPIEDKFQDGNRPSTTIVVKQFTPFTLGALMVLYEHKAFVQSVIWDVDPFVHHSNSLSMSTASEMLASLEDPRKSRLFNSSTNGLMAFIKKRLEIKTLTDLILVSYEFLYDPPVPEILRKGEIFNLAVVVASAYVWFQFVY